MNVSTQTIITAAVDGDSTVSKELRRAIKQMIETGNPRRWISESDAADLLGISRQLLWQWRKQGELAGERFPFTCYFPPALTKVSARYDEFEVIEFRGRRVSDPASRQEKGA